MASFLEGLGITSLNPVNSFPAYHGAYAVGTVDVEIPVSDLPAPCELPEGGAETIAFRIFYPCHKSEDNPRPVRWISQPQRATISAFAKFVGANHRLAGLISYMPQQLFWIKLPAWRNAALLEPPTTNGRWPVTFFSHGLAGSRNAYSYVCGDMASNGMIVIALDHRDGSSPIQYVRATTSSEARIIGPTKITHEPCREAFEGRDKQLRIRLWEMSLAYEALMKIDAGELVENLDSNTSWSRKERMEVLEQFAGMLDIHRQGRVSWAGHSFGAVTTVQLLKSIHYYREKPADALAPLIEPKSDAAIVGQITAESPTLLLDMWCLPLRSPDQHWLWDRPLPSYTSAGPKGDNVLSVLSEAFYNWEDNRNTTRYIIAGPQTSRRPSTVPRLTRDKGRLLPDWARLRDVSPASSTRDSGYASGSTPSVHSSRQQSRTSMSIGSTQKSAKSGNASSERTKGPHMFYPARSQHFNQSDYGILFPWIAKRFTKAEEPERILELNVRAMVQVIRESGIEVAGEDDKEILDKEAGLRRWIYAPVVDTPIEDTSAMLDNISRRLSVGSVRTAAPRDGMTMGMKTIDI
ncbi:hypothetical protein AMS68_003048 [Peltaster fructicola]|uniref:Putative phospholipase n=1 Tax=Peltaster fructicola TaxID=286661 RepID=A0A6H0XS99_9PEZI|nr:hypothetical protein AMS68_003048 [Peltaster fructicola]